MHNKNASGELSENKIDESALETAQTQEQATGSESENNKLPEKEEVDTIKAQDSDATKLKTSKVSVIFSLVAVIISLFALYQLLTTIDKIDFDNHVIPIEKRQQDILEDGENAELAKEALLVITPTKTTMTVAGDILLQKEIEEKPEESLNVATESDVLADAETIAENAIQSENEIAITSGSGEDNEAESDTKENLPVEKVSIPLLDGSCIDFIQGESICVVNDYIAIELVNAFDIDDEGMAVLDTTDGAKVVIMTKKVSEKTAVVGIAEAAEAEKIDAAKEFLKNVFEEARLASEDAIQNYEFSGMKFNPEWVKNFRMITSVIELQKEDGSKVYLSNFTNTITGAGMTTNAALTDSINAKYNPSIKDSSTGYIPFLYNHAQGTVKLLATTVEEVGSIFAQTVDVAAE